MIEIGERLGYGAVIRPEDDLHAKLRGYLQASRQRLEQHERIFKILEDG